MKDQNKTKKQLINELAEIRQKITGLTEESVSLVRTSTIDREQSEEALVKISEKHKELELIVNHSPVIVFLWRAAEGWPVEFVTDNIRQFGYTPEDFYSGRIAFSDIVYPDDQGRVRGEVVRYSQQGLNDFVQEYRIITKSGEVRWLDDRTWIRRDSDGNITHYQGIVLDITDRKEAEEALRVSERKFRTLTDEITDGVAVTIDGKNYWVNKAFSEIFGYTKEELIGKGVDFLIVPEEVPVLLKKMKARLAGKDTPTHYETIAKCKDGRRINIEVFAKVIPFEDKQAIQIVVRDITKRTLSEKRIANLIRMYATLSGVNGALAHIQGQKRFFKEVCKVAVEKGQFKMVWIGLLDEATKLVKPIASRGYIRGYLDKISISAKDIAMGKGPTGRCIREGKIIVNPNTKDNPDIKPWRDAMLERGYMSSCSIPIKVRERVIGALNLYSDEPYCFDEEEMNLAEELAEDISFGLNHMKVEEALQNSELKFRSVIEQSNDGIYVLKGTQFVFINPRFTEITGYKLHEISGDDFDFRQLVAESGKKVLEDRETMRKRGEELPSRYEFKGLRKDGQEIDLEVSVTRLDWGGMPATMGIVQDVSERIQARKKLEKALKQAKQANKVKSLFLANMSHEIRTPLNAILGFTDLIKQSTQYLLEPEEQAFFTTIEHSGKRLMHTVHEILDISQIEAGTFDLNPKPLDLNESVASLIQEFRPMAENKKLELLYYPTVKDSIIIADEYCINQTLSNLIDNAIKYTEEGKIVVSLKDKGDKLLLTIQDTGIGMSDEYLGQIFEVFSQESTGYTKKFQGVGLGLALTKGYLDMNGIGVDVKSSKGEGTKFTLTFKTYEKNPIKKTKESTQQVIVKTKEDFSKKPLILVVEDVFNSQNLVKFFTKEIYDLVFAVSVHEAKELLKNNPIELILLDLSLIGDEDGLDLARYLRKTKKWKKIPIIATTAHAFVTDRNNVLAAGCNDYLAKPIKQQELLKRIKRII